MMRRAQTRLQITRRPNFLLHLFPRLKKSRCHGDSGRPLNIGAAAPGPIDRVRQPQSKRH